MTGCCRLKKEKKKTQIQTHTHTARDTHTQTYTHTHRDTQTKLYMAYVTINYNSYLVNLSNMPLNLTALREIEKSERGIP